MIVLLVESVAEIEETSPHSDFALLSRDEMRLPLSRLVMTDRRVAPVTSCDTGVRVTAVLVDPSNLRTPLPAVAVAGAPKSTETLPDWLIDFGFAFEENILAQAAIEDILALAAIQGVFALIAFDYVCVVAA